MKELATITDCPKCGQTHKLLWLGAGTRSRRECRSLALLYRHGHLEGFTLGSHDLRDIKNTLLTFWSIPMERWSNQRQGSYRQLIHLWNNDYTLVKEENFDDVLFGGLLQDHVNLVMVDGWVNDKMYFRGETIWSASRPKSEIVLSRLLLDDKYRGSNEARRRAIIKVLLHEMLHAAFITYCCKCVCCSALENVMHSVGVTGHGPLYVEAGEALMRLVAEFPFFDEAWGPDCLRLTFGYQLDNESAVELWKKYMPGQLLPPRLRRNPRSY